MEAEAVELNGAERSVLATWEGCQDVATTAARHGLRQRTVREIVRKGDKRPAPGAERAPDGGWLVRLECSRCHENFHLLSEQEPPPLALRMARLWMRFCDACTELEEREALVVQQAYDRKKWLDGSGLPVELRGFQWSEMVAKGRRRTAIDAAQEWARGDGLMPGLFLTGPVGTGKTRLAATAAWERLSRAPIRWISVAKLMADLSKDFNDRDHKKARELLTAKGAVVLDDFDKVTPRDHGKNILFTAIDQRVQAKSMMIVTSNLPMGELGERFGDPIISRLAGHCSQLVLDGADMRLELVPDG